MAGRADSRHPVAFSIYLSLVGGASATPMLENGVLHVNYQQVQVMSAILMVGLSPLTKASATAGESQADAPIPDQVWLEAGNGQKRYRYGLRAVELHEHPCGKDDRHQREEGVERRERRGRSASGIGDSRAMLRERGWRNAASAKGFASAEGPGRGPFCVCFSSCCQAVGVSQ